MVERLPDPVAFTFAALHVDVRAPVARDLKRRVRGLPVHDPNPNIVSGKPQPFGWDAANNGAHGHLFVEGREEDDDASSSIVAPGLPRGLGFASRGVGTPEYPIPVRRCADHRIRSRPGHRNLGFVELPAGSRGVGPRNRLEL